jgi:hypothetical protein
MRKNFNVIGKELDHIDTINPGIFPHTTLLNEQLENRSKTQPAD